MLLAEVFDGKSLKTPELERIDEFFPDFKHKLRDLPDANKVPLECFILPSQYKNLKEPSALDRIAVLRIAHGCTSKCAYCGIRRATGRLRSKAPDVCIGELKRLLDSGHNIFIIEGEDTGPYGVDIGTTLAHLLTQFVEVAEDYKAIFILQTCSPQWAIRYKETLFDLIDSDYLKRVCIDVQTGSPRMAKLMRRYPNIEEVIKLNRRLRQTIQDFIWTSQFIVGLPSESEEDFQQTLDFIDQTQIDELTFFGYSEIKGTACAAIPDKVPQAVIEARLARAENLMKEKGFDTKGFPLASQREARHKDFLERVERLCLQV